MKADKHTTVKYTFTRIDDRTELIAPNDGSNPWRQRWMCGLDNAPAWDSSFIVTRDEWVDWNSSDGPMRIIHEWAPADQAAHWDG